MRQFLHVLAMICLLGSPWRMCPAETVTFDAEGMLQEAATDFAKDLVKIAEAEAKARLFAEAEALSQTIGKLDAELEAELANKIAELRKKSGKDPDPKKVSKLLEQFDKKIEKARENFGKAILNALEKHKKSLKEDPEALRSFEGTLEGIYEKALELDPGNAVINKAKGLAFAGEYGWIDTESAEKFQQGYRFVADKWISKTDFDGLSAAAKREQGYRELESTWLSPKLIADLDRQHASWSQAREIETEHFVFRSNLCLDHLLEAMEWSEKFFDYFHKNYGGDLGLKQKNKLVVLFFGDTQSYKSHVCSSGLSLSSMRGYSTNACQADDLQTRRPREIAQVIHVYKKTENKQFVGYFNLFHELVHQFIGAGGRKLTLNGKTTLFWVTEGFATYFEWPKDGDNFKEVIKRYNPADNLVVCKEIVANQSYIPLGKFMAANQLQFNQYNGSNFISYAQSAGLAHFFLHGDNGKYRDKFLKLVLHVHFESPNEGSFEKIMGCPPESLEKEWVDYIKELSLE